MRPSLKAKIIIDERRQHFRKVMAFENNVVVCIEAVTMLFQHTLGDCGKNSFFMNRVYLKGEFACCLKSCLYRKVKLFSKLVTILIKGISLFMKTKYNMNIFFYSTATEVMQSIIK